MSLQGAAARAVDLHGPGTPSFIGAATLQAYMTVLQAVFQPAAENCLSRIDFEHRMQGQEEPVTEYLGSKWALYQGSLVAGAERNFAYLRSEVLKGLYSPFVKAEVIRADPQDEAALQEAAIRAVGQGRESYHLRTGAVTSLDGLASTTLSNHLLQHRNERGGAEAMEVDKIGEDRHCFKCQKRGHLAANCTQKDRKRTDKKTDEIVCHYCSKEGAQAPRLPHPEARQRERASRRQEEEEHTRRPESRKRREVLFIRRIIRRRGRRVWSRRLPQHDSAGFSEGEAHPPPILEDTSSPQQPNVNNDITKNRKPK